MGWFWVLYSYMLLGALSFVVIGLFLGVKVKTLRWVLLVTLLLALIRILYVASEGSGTVVWLSLLLAIVISARLMFFRAP